MSLSVGFAAAAKPWHGEVLACPGGEAALLAAGFSKVDGASARALRSAPPGGERHPAARTWTAQMGLSECISGI